MMHLYIPQHTASISPGIWGQLLYRLKGEHGDTLAVLTSDDPNDSSDQQVAQACKVLGISHHVFHVGDAPRFEADLTSGGYANSAARDTALAEVCTMAGYWAPSMDFGMVFAERRLNKLSQRGKAVNTFQELIRASQLNTDPSAWVYATMRTDDLGRWFFNHYPIGGSLSLVNQAKALQAGCGSADSWHSEAIVRLPITLAELAEIDAAEAAVAEAEANRERLVAAAEKKLHDSLKLGFEAKFPYSTDRAPSLTAKPHFWD